KRYSFAENQRGGGHGKTHDPRRHCLSAISPLDVFIYASRGEITKSTGVSLRLVRVKTLSSL
ncbi:MAG: hypothetical protein IJQ80_01060, partial [Clostridia bacterium]|nr:hypothetical protein [Clostridia bacterium]